MVLFFCCSDCLEPKASRSQGKATVAPGKVSWLLERGPWTKSPGASCYVRSCFTRYGHGGAGGAIILAVMKYLSLRSVLFCVFLLVLQSVALLSHSESTGVQGTAPPAVQGGVAVSSSEGPVATLERRLDAPGGYGAGSQPNAPMATYYRMLRRPR